MPGDGSKTKPRVFQAWTPGKHQDYAQKVSSRSKWWPRPLITAIAAITAGLLAPELFSNRAYQFVAVAGVAIFAWDHRLIKSYYFSLFSRGAAELDASLRQPRLIKYPSLLFCGLIMGLLANVLISPISSPWLHYPAVPIALGSLIVIMVLPSIYAAALQIGGWIDSRPKTTHALFVITIFAGLFYLQITIASSLYFFPLWDPSYVLDSAFGLADGSLTAIDENYFSKYPNNITLTLLLAAFNHIMFLSGVSNLLLASILLNIIVVLSGVLLTYLAACRLAGTGAAVMSLLPSAVLVVVSPWITVPYSDTFGLLFPALLIYLYVRAKDATRSWLRISLWAGMGLTGAVGYSIKPTVIIVMLAITAVTLASLVDARRRRCQILPAIGSLIVLTSAFGLGTAALMHFETTSRVISFDLNKNAEAMPLTHFLKMGAQGLGGFNEQDALETLSIADPSERFTNGLDVYRQRVEAMGPAEYVNFLRRKAVWTFGDGTFYAWSEGPIATHDDPFISTDPVSRGIQSFLWVKGENFYFMILVWQSLWLAILFLVALPTFIRHSRNMFTESAAVMRISLFGLFLFLLLFETRSRYLFLYLPFFILLMVLTMDSVRSKMPRLSASSQRPTDISHPQDMG